MAPQAFDYVVVLDFEATCDDRDRPRPQEVIEFPSVLVATARFDVVDEFEAFVRPHHHPTLTRFCRELTGIRQEDVDGGKTFAEVLDEHMEWLRSHGLAVAEDESGPAWAFVLCGDWDLGTMLPAQCRAAVPPIEPVPWPYRRWINTKRLFMRTRGRRRAPGMARMLRALDLELIGRHHRGIDDCRNIARIVRALVERGATLEITTALPDGA